tara:strand:+ start:321 stop:551 length:231 start_codon:yes stop_codon:yes gene_type:complete
MAHIKLKSKEFNMSHFSTDLIADQAIDTVANMSDHDVKKALFNAGKRVLPKDMDAKRDILVDIVFGDLMDRPGPHG